MNDEVKKCECGRRFMCQGWKRGRERELCLTCFVIEKFFDEHYKFLTERERKVLSMRMGLGQYREPRTFEEIGKIFGVTRERIRQIEAKALERIRLNSKDA